MGIKIYPPSTIGGVTVGEVVAGTGISVDNTNPATPIVSSSVQPKQAFPFFFSQPDGAGTFYGLVSESQGDSDYTAFNANTPMPFAGTLTKLRLKGESVGMSANEILTASIDGVDTIITATITFADQSPTDLTHTQHFPAGAKVSIHYDPASDGNMSGFSGSIGVIWD